MSPRLRGVGCAAHPLAAALLVLLLAGCTATVALHPAPQAASTRCARLIVALREKPLAGLEWRVTDAQGTLAWGRPSQVTVVCGESEIPPSSRCLDIGRVEWAQTTFQSGDDLVDRYDTFGRVPDAAVFMTRLTVSPYEVLDELADAVRVALPGSGLRCG